MSIYLPSFYKESDADFIPKRRETSAVSNDEHALVTTTVDHGYAVDLFVRMPVQPAYGMVIDTVKAKILTVPDTTTFTIDLDTRPLSAYVTPTAPPAFSQAHTVPITGTVDNVA